MLKQQLGEQTGLDLGRTKCRSYFRNVSQFSFSFTFVKTKLYIKNFILKDTYKML